MSAFSVLFFLMGMLLVATAGPISLDRTYTFPEIREIIFNNKEANREEISKLISSLMCIGDTCLIYPIPATDTLETPNSVEDYVQGCGPRDENSYEANETFYKDDISKRSTDSNSQDEEKGDVEIQIGENEVDPDEEKLDDANKGDRKRRETKDSNESNSPESDESEEKKLVAVVASVIEAAASAPEGEQTQEANEPLAAAAGEPAAAGEAVAGEAPAGEAATGEAAAGEAAAAVAE